MLNWWPSGNQDNAIVMTSSFEGEGTFGQVNVCGCMEANACLQPRRELRRPDDACEYDSVTAAWHGGLQRRDGHHRRRHQLRVPEATTATATASTATPTRCATSTKKARGTGNYDALAAFDDGSCTYLKRITSTATATA